MFPSKYFFFSSRRQNSLLFFSITDKNTEICLVGITILANAGTEYFTTLFFIYICRNVCSMFVLALCDH